jgi:hypothetical protein
LQPTIKRVNKKRPPEPSDEFMVGKGAKWSKSEAQPDWDRGVSDNGKVQWKSPRFMSKTERKGAMRVKGILKKVYSRSYLINVIEGTRENGKGRERSWGAK